MKYRHIILLIAGTIFYFLVNFQRTVIPGAIFNELQSGLGSNAGYITALGSAFMYIYATCQLVTGLFVDRKGGFRTILLGGFFFALGSLAFPFCKSLWPMYLSRAFTGLGASCVYLSMIKELTRLYPKKFTVLFGIFMCVGYAGSITAGRPFVGAINQFPWRSVLGSIGLLTVAVYIAYSATIISMPKPEKKTTPWSFKPLLMVYCNPKNRMLASFTCFNWGLYYTLLTVIGKKYLEDYCKMSTIDATWVITIMGALSAGFNCLSGILSHALGNRRRPFLIGGASLATVSYLLMSIALAFKFQSPFLCVLFFLVTLTASQSPVQVAAMHELNTPETGGVTVAVLNFTSYLMVALFSNLCGMLLECFPPTVVDDIKIYGANSYLLFFAFATLVSLFGLIRVRLLPECGKA